LERFGAILMRLDANRGYMKRHSESLKLNIAYGLANGHTQAEIAKSLGVHQSTISRHSRRPDVAEKIREEEAKVIQWWEDRIQRAAQDPEVKAQAEKWCMKAILGPIPRMLGIRR